MRVQPQLWQTKIFWSLFKARKINSDEDKEMSYAAPVAMPFDMRNAVKRTNASECVVSPHFPEFGRTNELYVPDVVIHLYKSMANFTHEKVNIGLQDLIPILHISHDTSWKDMEEYATIERVASPYYQTSAIVMVDFSDIGEQEVGPWISLNKENQGPSTFPPMFEKLTITTVVVDGINRNHVKGKPDKSKLFAKICLTKKWHIDPLKFATSGAHKGSWGSGPPKALDIFSD
ncbi:hypothetical protein TNCV_2025541 [Trichonephila clavipes]|nr:hypothetical protein TNCV_2025541 [Trichonephila clavipes]